MQNETIKYKYYYRPGYGRNEFLINIFNGAEIESFVPDFLTAISSLNPNLNDITDLWMNDENAMTFESDFGEFILSRDIWGFAFVMSKESQHCIQKIYNLLLSNGYFELVPFIKKRNVK